MLPTLYPSLGRRWRPLLVALVLPCRSTAFRLYIIRHGDPDYLNLKDGLTEHGKAEARALAPFLEEENVTRAYTSPMRRARLTAELALADIPRFSALRNDDDVCAAEADGSVDDGTSKHRRQVAKMFGIDRKNNFERNVPVEEWCGELVTWQAGGWKRFVGAGTVLWDLPATVLRNQLDGIASGGAHSGWAEASPDHGAHLSRFREFGDKIDDFLSRHGVYREKGGPNYRMGPSDVSDPSVRNARIVIFCHGGMGLTLLSHLLRIPLPMVHASMWLAPSSVTTILFEEYAQGPDGDGGVVLTPRATCIGGTAHLAKAGLEIALSKYEAWERPSGLKRNYL